jgi:DNA processing protein
LKNWLSLAFDMEDLIYKIAITLIPNVGCVNGKNLIAYCGGVEAVFTEKKRFLMKIPGIGETTVNSIINHNVFERAEEELKFIQKYNITSLFYLDAGYPSRLKQCTDSPLMLYYKGNTDLNNDKIISIVGTRHATEYGRDMCRRIVEGLSGSNVLVISGLAYGIDTWSHKAAMEFNLPTVAALGHGLDRIYPNTNKPLAEKMLANGGLITEFMSQTKPDRENFPMRNRIIAGMSDAVIVVEAGAKGGALITADLANSYNRDVFAVPGRLSDSFSEGCNNLIKTNRAALIQSADDIRYILNWDSHKNFPKVVQRKLFVELPPEEQSVIDLLRNEGDLDIDTVIGKTGMQPSKAASALLNLEFEGIVRCLPGKIYRLC